MLEECGLPYRVIPLNIARGDQFKPEFLAISPNNRMPAIVDPAGPGGRPISIFESGAILQYLGRKTGRFYPATERARVEVDQWLFWQMANLGPKAGECHHFRLYAPERERLQYAVDRFTNECNRLYGVMNAPPRRPRISSPATIRSPTWPASAGPAAGSGRARTSTRFRTSSAGSIACWRGRPSTRACTSGWRRRPRSSMEDPDDPRHAVRSARALVLHVIDIVARDDGYQRASTAGRRRTSAGPCESPDKPGDIRCLIKSYAGEQFYSIVFRFGSRRSLKRHSNLIGHSRVARPGG